MLWLLALIACIETKPEDTVTADPIPTPPPTASADIPEVLRAPDGPVTLPGGQPIVRMSCFGGSNEDYSSPKKPSTRSGGYGSGPGNGASGLTGGATASSGANSPPATPAPQKSKPQASPMAAYDPAPAVETAPDTAAGRREPAKEAKKSKDNAGDDGLASKGSTKADPKPMDVPMEAPVDKNEQDEASSGEHFAEAWGRSEAEKQEPKMDWGATVYLSNDDSMSLASAQHLLHAVKHGQYFSVSEIRPHELLNYFSFDTAEVAPGQLFSVQASAAKTADDTLTVAMAVKGAMPPRRPLDLTMVLDRSGSMSAEGRMEYTKRGLTLMSDQLQYGDRVDLVLFDDRVCTPLENYVVGRDDPAILKDVIAHLRPEGSTDIGIGLKEGYRIAAASDRLADTTRNRRMMLITDAQVNTGDIDPNSLASITDNYEKHGIRLTGVGVGIGFNDEVLDELTEKGKGAYVYLGSEAVVDRIFTTGFASLTQTIAHDVQFSLDLPDSLAMRKFYGEEASTNAADIQPINYYAGTSQLFLQDLQVDPKKLSPDDAVTMTIKYRDAITGKEATQSYRTSVTAMMDADPHNLAKGRALMAWTEVLTAQAMGGDPCGAPLTAYAEQASRVADDAEIAYVTSLIAQRCNVPAMTPAPTVAYKVRVDSDVPIAEVTLDCGDRRQVQKLSGSDTIARFTPKSGSCRLVLDGNVPMETVVKVSNAGGDVKCTVRGGRMSCG